MNAHEVGSIAVMRAKVGLAKALGLTVVCEGIDSQADEEAAIQTGCDLLQGFRYSQPALLGTFLNQSASHDYALRAFR
jgi:EAL domain-containing protein (putative c-di-GMP-specific phosphodiesterase class I)